MKKILLIGAGGHARSCIDVIEMNGEYDIGGLIEKDNVKNNNNLGYEVIGSDKDLESLRERFDYAIVTIGQIKSAKIRNRPFAPPPQGPWEHSSETVS